MLAERGQDRRGIARVDHGGVDTIVDQPQVVILESGQTEDGERGGGSSMHNGFEQTGVAWITQHRRNPL